MLEKALELIETLVACESENLWAGECFYDTTHLWDELHKLYPSITWEEVIP